MTTALKDLVAMCDSSETTAAENERTLVARLQQGEAEAFEELVRTYCGRMLATIRRFLKNDADAQDALQDALLSSYRSIKSFESSSQLGTWLHRIAVNAALMRLRRRSRHPEGSIEDLLPQFVEDGHQRKSSTPWHGSAEELWERRETAEVVRRSIDQLPESYRSILLLRDIEEVDTEETARMLNISVGAVKTRLHRARQALRTLLDNHFQGELV